MSTDGKSPTPKWKAFEELAASIQRQFVDDKLVNVTTNEKIEGRHSKQQRQIDICIRQNVAQYSILIVIDCKDYKVPVDVKDVETFLGLLDDVGANKGAIIAANGFSPAAKTRAAQAGVDLHTLVDAGSTQWSKYVKVPAIVVCSNLRGFNLEFSGTGPIAIPRFEKTEDYLTLLLYRADGTEIGVIGSLLLDRWKDGTIPQVNGHHVGTPLTSEETWIETDGARYQVKITVNADVEIVRYFRLLALVETQGLQDEIRGVYTTRMIRTAPIDVRELERDWRRVTEKEAQEIKPTLGFHFSSIPDVLPAEGVKRTSET